MEFYRNILIEYSLIGIVNPKFTREKWNMMQNFKINLSKNVRKNKDRTSLMSELVQIYVMCIMPARCFCCMRKNVSDLHWIMNRLLFMLCADRSMRWACLLLDAQIGQCGENAYWSMRRSSWSISSPDWQPCYENRTPYTLYGPASEIGVCFLVFFPSGQSPS